MNHHDRAATSRAVARMVQAADLALSHEIDVENADAARQELDVQATIHAHRSKAWSDKHGPNNVSVTLTLTVAVPHTKEEE